MVEQARARSLAESVEQTGLQELAHVATFDGVLCIDAMEHVPPEDWPRVVHNLGRACGDGGLVYLSLKSSRTSKRIWTEPWLRRSRKARRRPRRGRRRGHRRYRFYPADEQIMEWLEAARMRIVEDATDMTYGEWGLPPPAPTGSSRNGRAFNLVRTA